MSKGWMAIVAISIGVTFTVGETAFAQTPAARTEVQLHLQRARDALGAHDLRGAAAEYSEILKLAPESVEGQTGLGVTLYGLGRPRDAAIALENASRLDPGQKTALLFLGLSRAALGQCATAIPLLKQSFPEGTDPKLRRLVGLGLVNCYEDQAQFEQAREAAQELNRLNPGDPEILFHLAEIYSSMLNTTVDELLKKHPDSYRFHQIAGETLEAQGNYKQAIKEYKRALDINPTAVRIHYRIARLILRTADKSEADREAMQEFRNELTVHPDDAASEYQIGEILLTNHQSSEARQSFTRVLELSPEFAEARIGLAKVELQEHQYELAVSELNHAVRLQPKNAAAHYTLMLAYRDLGSKEQAAQELEQFQKLKAQESIDFRSELRGLLSGGGSEPEGTRAAQP